MSTSHSPHRNRLAWLGIASQVGSVLLSLPAAVTAERPRIVGYYASWSERESDYAVTDIPATLLTHVNYAFARISPAGECTFGNAEDDVLRSYPGDEEDTHPHGHLGQLLRLKRAHPHLRTLISIGGWDWSDRFSTTAATAVARRKFAASCVGFMRRYGFDGIDIDWEFPVSGGKRNAPPRPQERRNFTLLVSAVRAQLDAHARRDQRRYLLTAAMPAAPETRTNFELDRVHPYLDWINLMTYDLWGSWAKITSFHAPLRPPFADQPLEARRDVEAAITFYLAAGVPAEKIVVGIPFYGRGVKGVPDQDRGLFQPHHGPAAGTWGDEMFSYRDLRTRYVGRLSPHWHAPSQASWLYDPQHQWWISYETPRSCRAKVQRVRAQSLGGVMVWELSMDEEPPSLLRVLHTELQSALPSVKGVVGKPPPE